MAKTIIGIHGLANKPPRDTLAQWWEQALREGLAKNVGAPTPDFRFHMVYWADLLYKNPLHQDQRFAFDALYNDEIYIEAAVGALQVYEESWLDEIRSIFRGVAGSMLDTLRHHFEVDLFTAWALGKLARDLAFYYDDDRQIHTRQQAPGRANRVLRDELQGVLEAEKANEIMLIAHSMGSIIAYDALRDLGRGGTDVTVPYLVTIGSPLGLPYVKWQIQEQRDYDPRVRTPSIVTQDWRNFADRRDKVAADSHLGDDYGANRHGVHVIDDLVRNDYEGTPGKPNPHKSYGYLRTPELSRHVQAFLEGS